MKRTALGLALMVGMTGPAGAGDGDMEPAMRLCAQIQGAAERLACFDGLVTAASRMKKGWNRETTVDRMTGTGGEMLWTLGRDLERCGGAGAHFPRLEFRCVAQRMSLVFVTESCVFGSAIEQPMETRFRVDGNEPMRYRVSPGIGNNSFGFWAFDSESALASQMMSGNELLVEFRPFGHSPFVVGFRVTGLFPAIQPMREVCPF